MLLVVSSIAQRELTAHLGTLHALGDNRRKGANLTLPHTRPLRFCVLVPQCAQGFPMRNQFALRNTEPHAVRKRKPFRKPIPEIPEEPEKTQIRLSQLPRAFCGSFSLPVVSVRIRDESV